MLRKDRYLLLRRIVIRAPPANQPIAGQALDKDMLIVLYVIGIVQD